MNPVHKKFIIFAMIFLCLEYLDIIVYLKNMHQLINATGYKYNYKLGISIMIGFLWISRFIGYRLADKLTKLHNNFNYTPSTTSLLIGLTFVMQAFCIRYANLFDNKDILTTNSQPKDNDNHKKYSII